MIDLIGGLIYKVLLAVRPEKLQHFDCESLHVAELLLTILTFRVNLYIEKILLQGHLDHVLILALRAIIADLVDVMLGSDLLLLIVIHILDVRAWRVRLVILKEIIGSMTDLVLGRVVLVCSLLVLLFKWYVCDVTAHYITLLLP